MVDQLPDAPHIHPAKVDALKVNFRMTESQLSHDRKSTHARHVHPAKVDGPKVDSCAPQISKVDRFVERAEKRRPFTLHRAPKVDARAP